MKKITNNFCKMNKIKFVSGSCLEILNGKIGQTFGYYWPFKLCKRRSHWPILKFLTSFDSEFFSLQNPHTLVKKKPLSSDHSFLTNNSALSWNIHELANSRFFSRLLQIFPSLNIFCPTAIVILLVEIFNFKKA